MKKLFLPLLSLYLLASTSIAQIDYEAMVRDKNGVPVANAKLTVEVSFIEDYEGNTPTYTETFEVFTSKYGMVILSLGEGNPKDGEFDAIKWGKTDVFLQTSYKITSVSPPLLMGTFKLNSVPLSYYAKNASVADSVSKINTSKDIYINDIGSGVILKSPNGNCWRVQVDNSGNLTRTAITCP